MSDDNASRGASLLNLPFVIAVVLLVGVAVLMGPLASHFGYRSAKKPLELRASLDSLDASRLGPYEVVHKNVLAPTVIEQLGTESYIDWVLKDTRRKPNETTYRVHLHVAYYTGGHYLAVHRPDVCMIGSGYELADAENTYLEIKTLAPERSTVPIRVCTFQRTKIFDDQQFVVPYTFFCIDEFRATEKGVRFKLNDPSYNHAFFCKVELRFMQGTAEAKYASKEESLTASADFLSYVLPILISDHWPDVAEVEQALAEEN